MSVPELAFEPKVYLVGKQAIDESAMDDFLRDEGVVGWETDTEVGAEKLVEVAGRVCYMSFAKPRPGGNSKYIEHIIDVGHGSVLEHAVYNLIFTGVSRSLTHELVRHRAGFGFSQLSQRYVDESDTSFVVPPALEREVAIARQFLKSRNNEYVSSLMDAMEKENADELCVGIEWLAFMDNASERYKSISEYLAKRDAGKFPDKTSAHKAAREASRSVLPNATETKIFVTLNARAARHFIEMRGSGAADAEIRRLAQATQRVLAEDSPNLFGDYVFLDGGVSCIRSKA